MREMGETYTKNPIVLAMYGLVVVIILSLSLTRQFILSICNTS